MERTVLSLNPAAPPSGAPRASGFPPQKEGVGRRVPDAVRLEAAAGALDGVLGPPALVPRLEHLAEAAARHWAPGALEVVAGEDGEAAQPLLHARGHGVGTARALQAPRAPGRPGCTLRFLRGRFQEGGVASGEELVQPCEGGESQPEP